MLLGYDVSGRIVQAIIIGNPTYREVRAMMEAAFSDPRLSGRGRLLIDASQAQMAASESELRNAAARLASFQQLDGHCAIVVGAEVGCAQASLLSVYAAWSGLDVRVFRDSAKAITWLEAPHDAEPGAPS
jgi:hypothetical protein